MFKKVAGNELVKLMLKLVVLQPEYLEMNNINDLQHVGWFVQSMNRLCKTMRITRNDVYSAYVVACEIYELGLFDIEVKIYNGS